MALPLHHPSAGGPTVLQSARSLLQWSTVTQVVHRVREGVVAWCTDEKRGKTNTVGAVWILMSLLIVGGGLMHCSAHHELRALHCDADSCIVTVQGGGGRAQRKMLEDAADVGTVVRFGAGAADGEEGDEEDGSGKRQFKFLREQLLRTKQERVRPDEDGYGEIVDTSRMARRRVRKLGYSYSVTFRKPDAERSGKDKNNEGSDSDDDDEVVVLMATSNTGRRKSRQKQRVVLTYLRGEADSVELVEEKNFTTLGIVIMIIGSLSGFFGFLFLFFADDAVSRKRR